MQQILLSCDFNCCRITENQYRILTDIINNLANGKTVITHIYNYIDKKHTFITPSDKIITHPYLGSHKKVALDIAQALDCVQYATQNNNDEIYLLCGEYESEYLTNKLGNMNMTFHKITVGASKITIDGQEYSIDINEAILQTNNVKPSDIIIDKQPDQNEESTIFCDKNREILFKEKLNNIPKEKLAIIYSYLMNKKIS